MTKLTASLRNIANAPKNCRVVYISMQGSPYIYLKRKLLYFLFHSPLEVLVELILSRRGVKVMQLMAETEN